MGADTNSFLRVSKAAPASGVHKKGLLEEVKAYHLPEESKAFGGVSLGGGGQELVTLLTPGGGYGCGGVLHWGSGVHGGTL
ncbi:unnamed protein product [Lota lota]